MAIAIWTVITDVWKDIKPHQTSPSNEVWVMWILTHVIFLTLPDEPHCICNHVLEMKTDTGVIKHDIFNSALLYVFCTEPYRAIKGFPNSPAFQNWPSYHEMSCCLREWMWCLKMEWHFVRIHQQVFEVKLGFVSARQICPTEISPSSLLPESDPVVGYWSDRIMSIPFSSRGRKGIFGAFIFLKESL